MIAQKFSAMISKEKQENTGKHLGFMFQMSSWIYPTSHVLTHSQVSLSSHLMDNTNVNRNILGERDSNTGWGIDRLTLKNFVHRARIKDHWNILKQILIVELKLTHLINSGIEIMVIWIKFSDNA